ncbi:hypothetical protein CQW23_04329 [Capsicum baccatum]|uniref:O-methyltransferase C-terminal domain-containing protein n=1 Tax=Capsicum baccatum TaxID=33114 RepID=A0A2G2XEB7_CAPBA|nr:hypothetical protein CQW23_04329 [Capsicum baccatum]
MVGANSLVMEDVPLHRDRLLSLGSPMMLHESRKHNSVADKLAKHGQKLTPSSCFEASESSNQEEGWVVCRVFKKKNYHKALESPQNSSAALSRRGDMFQSIPHADPILLKLVMHNWSDEDCVKILQRCREASTYNNEGRKEKVLIIDVVLNRDKDEADTTEVKLLFDVMITVLFAGVCVCAGN